jgi:hypothetical protein
MRMARPSPEDPIRAELFGIERLEQHAESLAAAQAVMKRSGGLSEDVVIAPYATGLAAMIDPAAAVQNFRRLAAAGAR